MNLSSNSTQIQFHAISMELAANLDERCVEMHIVTDKGEKVGGICPRNSIFAVQRHIELLGSQCPEIAEWGTVQFKG